MYHLEKILITSTSKLRQAMELIDQNSAQICFITDEKKKLLGSLTDGDIRRALLKGATLETPVSEAMTKSPKSLSDQLPRDKVIEKMKELGVKHVPLLDEHGIVTKIEFLDDMLGITKRENRVILMVGGMGKRLSPLTDHTPKPMLPINGIPILERILLKFKEVGFYNFSFAVNYKSEIITQYFGDGSKWNVNIDYVHETNPLGTCGAISLMKNKPTESFIVMNGDLLTQANFSTILDYHDDLKSTATMCIREFEVQVPYGVVKVNGNRIESIHEKPKEIAYINAGIYVFSPEIFKHIPENQYFDMPSLFNSLKKVDLRTYIYNLKDYWLDIGRLEDYQRAQIDYEKLFK
jgi:dTDP-glucose pyrophosphorylase